MTSHLYLAPAAAGKTSFAIDLARHSAQTLQDEVWVCVASRVQVQSWQRRLAEAGGALGVRVLTFDELYEACLAQAGESYTRLGEAVQYRLIRDIVDQVPLEHYRPLQEMPGFVQVLQSTVKELKGAMVRPEAFLQAVANLGDSPRLRELGLIYQAYQDRLRDRGWADYAGVGWLAVEVLEGRAHHVGRDWSLLIVDGFDSFTEVQLALLQLLATRVESLVITLTGVAAMIEPRPVHHRFHRARQTLEQRLEIQAKLLPQGSPPISPVLSHLEANLFADEPAQIEGRAVISLIEAPDQAAEIREALRWLKERIVHDALSPGEVALLARDLTSYRPFIVQTAVEFGLPIRLLDGLPLRTNPAIRALLDLLSLLLPDSAQGGEPLLPRPGVVSAWRSPYFDWANVLPAENAPEPIGIQPGDAEILDAVARWGRVIGGHKQWREALMALAGREEDRPSEDKELLPVGVVAGDDALELAGKFERFLRRLEPSQEPNWFRDWVAWLEKLIGADPSDPSSEDSTSLHMVAQICQAGPDVRDLDLAALQSLKEILRSLVWTEAGTGTGQRIDYARFLSDLTGAIEAAIYQPPSHPGREEILVASAIRARGVPFRAIALVGMAEGQFPAALQEDPFLRESDRQYLAEEFNLRLDSSVESNEREFFYETITTPWEHLLLTRPRLTDSGAEWLASPFWEEIRRLFDIEPVKMTTESRPPPQRAASIPELVESLVVYPNHGPARNWFEVERSEQWQALSQAAQVFGQRYDGRKTIFEGDLTSKPAAFSAHFYADYGWSPSSLESYRTCPYFFFVGRVLGLKPRVDPEEGLDAAQLGSIYHEILETLYRSLDADGRADPDRLLAALPELAKKVLDQAPRRLGFRETAWWRQTRLEIEENVARTVQALAQLPGEYIPLRFEARFFGSNSLKIVAGGDQFRLHGVIDRVDRDQDGRLRVIDYKLAGPYRYSKTTLERGEKLQLPLYALAAGDALGLGQPADGFYWHIIQAQPSGLQLADYGAEAAIGTAVSFAWEAVRGARQGDFRPRPPADGCPGYCPAAAFCWQYRPGSFR